MIKTEGLTKIFKSGFRGRKIAALQDLNLEVKEGEIFGFLGPNGAGKTTTLKILMGLIYPTSGKAWLLDKELGNVDVKECIGFLPEHPYFYDYLTAGEFLKFYGGLFNIQRSELKHEINNLIRLVGLEGANNLQLRKFSKGMLQRIGLAQALINDPRLVLLDEPMSGLDPIGRKEIRDIILRLRDEGKTIFFSSHIIPDVELICNRVGILMKGRLLDIGKLDEILDARVKYVEVVVKYLPEDTIYHIKEIWPQVYRGANQISIRVENERDVGRVLDIIRDNKGTVISVTPNKETLEEHFIREIEEKG